jgi:hypothetical protein
MYCLALTCCMNVNYVVDNEQEGSHLFHCVVYCEITDDFFDLHVKNVVCYVQVTVYT